MTNSKIHSEPKVLKSLVKFDEPPDGANMAKMLIEAFQKHSERVLLVDVVAQEELTGGELYKRVGNIATNLLEKFNFKPGQVAFTCCDHCGPEILTVLGLVLAGGAIYGSNIEDGYGEDKVLCNLVKPDIFICQSGVHENILKLREGIDSADSIRIVWVDNPLKNKQLNDIQIEHFKNIIRRDNVIIFDDLIQGQPNNKLLEDVAYNQLNPERDVLTYMLTSGSTGRPKVVKSTHQELMFGLYSMISATRYPPNHIVDLDDNNNNNNNHIDLNNNNNKDHNYVSNEQDLNSKTHYLLPMDCNSVFSGDLPLDHGAGINTMFLSIYKGSKFIIMASYREDVFWQSVHDYRITSSIASTTFTYKLFARLKELTDSGEAQRKWDLSCLKHITCCGSKMAFIDLAKEIRSIFPNINVCQCYGATEMGFMAMLPIDESPEYLHSIGYLFPGMVGKVVDQDSGKLCAPYQRGQLHVWSKSKFKRYMVHPDDDPDLMIARCHDQEGFYMTGDQVHYDERERLYIHGRIKDTLFLMQDWKILPEELESLINEHPLVEFSVVVGVPDKDLPGCDSPKAFIKLIESTSSKFAALNKLTNGGDNEESLELIEKLSSKDCEFLAKHVFKFVAERTAKPKHLKGGVRFLDEFPRVGLLNKIDRKVLKQMD